jgi:hypothetical protein
MKSWFTIYDIKLIAAFLMVIDHLGITFDIFSFRWLGRFAFPLFGFLLVNGITKTSSPNKYYFRLLTFALISQVPYSIFHLVNGLSQNLNILFLFVGVYPVIYYVKRQAWFEVLFFTVVAIFFSFYCSYGLYGLALLISIYLFSELDVLAWVYWSFVQIYGYLFQVNFQIIVFGLPILFSNFQKLPLGQKARWFYWFYPLHFVPLIFLKYVTSL